MASQTATRTLPPLPPSTRPSDVHCDASAIHMHIRCARAPPPAAAPTTSHCRPAGSTHDGRGFVAGAMDFTVVGENRGEGRGMPRPHGLPGCHPHPDTSTPPPPSRPRASPLASWTPRSQPTLNHQRGVGGSSHLCSNAYRTAFAIHVVGRRTAVEAVVHSHCLAWPLPPRGGWGSSRGHLASQATPRSTITASANLAPSSGPSGQDPTVCAMRRGEREATDATPTSQALRQPSHSIHRARATTIIESGRLQPDSVS
jgi:hypothetical protein